MDVTLITRFIDARIGGIGTYAENVYEGLKNREDVNLKVITQEDSILPYTDNPLEYFYYSYLELKWILNKKKYKNSDVFHALSPMEAIRANKSKTVVTIHDVYDVNQNKSIREKILLKSIKESIKCEHIVLNNSKLLEPLQKYGGVDLDKITILGPPISDIFHPEPKENDTFTVGTIARLDHRKRNEILIKSFLDADMENSELLIGGKGPELEKLEKVAKGDERVKFLGYVSDNQVNKFYNSLDVFVFPSKYEGYGMPIVEAMACEKPVITLEDADIPNEVKEKTFICSEDELYKVLRDRTYKCDIKSNLQFYKSHTIEKRAEKIINIYKNI